jgi:hypothetical protein
MAKGKLIRALPTINEIRIRASENLSKLPSEYKQLTSPPEYPVELSESLKDLIGKLRKRIAKTEVATS